MAATIAATTASALPLQGRSFDFSASPRLADAYAASLLTSLGAAVRPPTAPDSMDAPRDWAASGLLPLIGYADSPPMLGPAALASCANGALAALRRLAGRPLLAGVSGASLLSERAAFLHLRRQGRSSAGGGCRLLPCADGWLAVNLARADDWELLPAWIENDVAGADWEDLAIQLCHRSASQLAERGRLLGLAVARVLTPQSAADTFGGPWWRRHAAGPALTRASGSTPLVVDLSSLWAGPLAGHLLLQAGAQVIKVESPRRPDGARRANADFYDLLNAGKDSVVIDFHSAAGRAQLHALLCRADIVIESSRPRALAQLGMVAEELLAETPGLTWLSITGYGRREPQAQWVAFGDDAACAAGLSLNSERGPVFCGDALADPLAGLHAALAALAWWQAGSGALLDISLVGVGVHCLRALASTQAAAATIRGSEGQWQLSVAGRSWPVEAPRRRRPAGPAATLGEDTVRILTRLGIPC